MATAAIGGLLARRALLSGDRLAVVSQQSRVSFAELNDRANRAARVLQTLGIGRGDRVALLMRNGVEFCELFYAIGRIGAICCPLNHRLTSSEVAVILEDCDAGLLIYDPFFQRTVDDLGEKERAGLALLPLTEGGGGSCSYVQHRHAASAEPVFVPVDESDVLLLVYTSGTTGRPKGALISHEQLFWASLTIGHTVDFRFADVHLLPVPMFHVGGLSFTVHFVHIGATAIIPTGWDAGDVLALIEAEGVNHFFAVPTMLADLARHPDFEAQRLGSLRWIMSGAAPLPADLVRRFADVGVPIQQSYGATETCGPAMCVDAGHVEAKPGSIGLPFFHTEVRIVSDNGDEAAPEELGEILIRGRHIFSGYWRNVQATRAAFDGPWFRSGDIGCRDADGYAYLVDRKNDMIISGGENIYPREIEAVIERHEAVAAAAVIPAADERWGEVVCAVVALWPGRSLDLADLVAHCEPHLARYKLPKRLIVRDELPRNATGKIVRAALRREIESG